MWHQHAPGSLTTPDEHAGRIDDGTAGSDREQRFERPSWELDLDRITWRHDPAGYHNRHHSRLADRATLSIRADDLLEQTRLEPVDLQAGIAQPGEFHDCLGTESQASPSWKLQQIDSMGGDILSEFARGDLGGHLVEQLRMNEVNLPEIRLRGIASHPRKMLHGCAEVRVAFDTEAGHKGDGFSGWLAEAVFIVAAH